MGQDIAFPRQFDSKHRTRQHLRHRSFRDDLLFFGHGSILGKVGPLLKRKRTTAGTGFQEAPDGGLARGRR